MITEGSDESRVGETNQRPEKVILSFIIPALNEEQRIGGCLRSIQQLELPAGVGRIEIVVVDNRSTDRTVQLSQEHGAKVVNVAPGFPSRARNVGARSATGDWLAFVDADCELASDWLSVCGSHLLKDVGVVAVGAAMRDPGSDTPWVERAWYELAYARRAGEFRKSKWLPSFNLLVRRSAFDAIGGFDESLSTCEDCDLGYRLATLGGLILDSRTHAAHLGESRSLSELFRREAWRTRGNLRLAVSRPFDWSNWMSLLFPPVIVASLAVAVGGCVAAFTRAWPVWPWFGFTAFMGSAIMLLVLRKTASTNLWSLLKQMMVFLTYLAGRTTGLVWASRRVER
jgi:glycosyltransferase involved in cell wall biosynthesis